MSHSAIDGARRFLAAPSITKTGTWFKDELSNKRFTRKLFGKAPWHRKMSADSMSSVSSSVLEVLRSATPPGTPKSSGTVDCTCCCVSGLSYAAIADLSR